MALFNFFTKSQDLICVEVLANHIRAAHVRARIREGEFKMVKFKRIEIDFSHTQVDLLASTISSLINQFRLSRHQHVILGFHNNTAVTTRLNASVSRVNTGHSLQEPELEDLLFKAQWRIFDKTRSVLSSKMGISDLDLHLVDAKVEEVRLDGHKVINPVGFRPRLIEFDIANTFVSKRLIQSLRKMLKEKQRLELIIESDAALVNSILRAFKTENGIVVTIGKTMTKVMVTDNRNLVYNQHFTWGLGSLVGALGKFFSVSPAIAYQILECYVDGNMSGYLAKKVERVLNEELGWFFEGIEIALETTHAQVELPNAVFLNQEIQYPDFVLKKMRAYKWPKKIFNRQPQLNVIQDTFVSSELRINQALPNSFAALLAEFLYGEKGERQLNSLLHKRIKWLEV